MKIAVSSTGNNLDSMVDPRFGRCQYLIYADPETLQFEYTENPGMMAGGGAGIATGQAIAAKGVEAVLTGNCGPNAYQVLSAAGIKVVTGVAGKVKDAIQDYKAGKYQTTSQPNVSDHFGMGRTGMAGGGGGRGMGGGGKGMGGGRGAGRT
jgi:predicted Fe-Mo cluster-binding NifX family protein